MRLGNEANRSLKGKKRRGLGAMGVVGCDSKVQFKQDD